MEKRKTLNRYSPEVRERAVRMVLDHAKDHASQWEAIASIAAKIGCTAETLRLNQIEIRFSILAGQSLKGASFGSVAELVAHIESFINSYNEDTRPFVWTKSAVHQKRLKPCFAA